MKSKDIINADKENSKINVIKSKNNLMNIKSDYFIKKLFDIIPSRLSLEIIKYNIKIQKRLNININVYELFSELYSSIELEITPIQKIYGSFINIKEEENKYFHIYFNGNKEETKKTELNRENKVSKIKIIIDYIIKSFKELFRSCLCIEFINFKKFCRNNITDMSGMFSGCSSLKELNLNNFNTNNVTDMSGMFSGCSLLKGLNLSNFNTNKVNDMSRMFSGCSSLKELNVFNFNTKKVTNMSYMFYQCSSLKELNLSNFNTNKVNDMSYMFSECPSLNELNLSNFNTNNVTYMSFMFSRCSSLKELKISNFNTNKAINMEYMFDLCLNELKNKIRNQYKNFQEKAFDDY